MVDPEAVSRAGVGEALDLEVSATTMAAHSTAIKAAANAELPLSASGPDHRLLSSRAAQESDRRTQVPG